MDAEPSESELATALKHGSREAAEILVDRSYRLVYASLFRLCGDSEEAADLTQETYRKAWSSLGSFRVESSFTTWLYRIAYNTFISSLRRRRPVVPIREALNLPASNGSEKAAVRLDAARVREEVTRLPEPLRFVVTAHYYGEQPVRDIADALGLTVVAVRKRLKAWDFQSTDLREVKSLPGIERPKLSAAKGRRHEVQILEKALAILKARTGATL